jgi:hypothetical protein
MFLFSPLKALVAPVLMAAKGIASVTRGISAVGGPVVTTPIALVGSGGLFSQLVNLLIHPGM